MRCRTKHRLFLQGVIQSNQPKSKWEGLTFVLILSVAAAVVGSSTQFGFNTGVINSPKKVSGSGPKTNAFDDIYC